MSLPSWLTPCRVAFGLGGRATRPGGPTGGAGRPIPRLAGFGLLVEALSRLAFPLSYEDIRLAPKGLDPPGRRLRLAVYAPPASKAATQLPRLAALAAAAGVSLRPYCEPDPAANLHVVWGARSWQVIEAAKAARRPYLVLELGYYGDRHFWTSLAYNGLHGRGFWPAPGAEPRPRVPLRPWRADGEYALLCGQVDGDVALTAMPRGWYETAVDSLKYRDFGTPVVFRGHPRWGWGYPANADDWHHGNPQADRGLSLAKAASKAKFAVMWNSTVGVELVALGVPCLVMDEGSPIWSVAGHGLDAEPPRPCREAWAHAMSWRQWAPGELGDGSALAWALSGYDEARARAERGEYGEWPKVPAPSSA